MKGLLLLTASLCIVSMANSQEKAMPDVQKSDNAKYFHLETDKPISKLQKDEVAFTYKGDKYYVKNGKIFKMRVDKDKLIRLSYGEIYDMAKDCPSVQAGIHSADITSRVALSFMELTAIPVALNAVVIVGAVPMIAPPTVGLIVLGVSESKSKKATTAFYNDYLTKLPKYDLKYSVNYVPTPFVKSTGKDASKLTRHEVAFEFDGEKYYIDRGRMLYKESTYTKKGFRMLSKQERLALMKRQGNYAFNELGRFYAEMNNVPVEKPDVEDVQPEPVIETTPTVTQEPAIEEVEVKDEKAEEPANVEEPKEEKQPTITEEPKKVAEPKPQKVRPEKLNVRKPNGIGIFADAGGLATRGPRAGLEFRLGTLMPSIFVGCPHLGSMYGKDYEDYESVKSISAGIGCKALIPASWGGFYAGAYAQYNRISAELNAGKYNEQKIFDTDIDIMAGVGFRFQTKGNLFCNIGGYAGPAINTPSSRYSNVLHNNYSPTYQKGDKNVKIKANLELSIGYEF